MAISSFKIQLKNVDFHSRNDEMSEPINTLRGYPLHIPDAEVTYFPNLFPSAQATMHFKQLAENIDWVQNKITMYGKENPVPRLEAWYGDEGMHYSYSGIQMEPKPWTETLLELKSTVEPIAGTIFNSVLINYYRDGNDRVGWHSDDEKELGEAPIIGSVSLGAERRFKLRHKQYALNRQKAELILENGSLLMMKGDTQRFWKHEIPRTAVPVAGRINLTFRVIRRS